MWRKGFIGLLTMLNGCGGEQEASAPLPLVRAIIVQPGLAQGQSFTGIVRARSESQLAFRVPGRVTARLVEPGQIVRRGQLLARLDPSDLALAASAARSGVAAARAEAGRSASELRRLEPLARKGFVSKRALDQARADAGEASARLLQSQAEAEMAGNQSGYANLLADSDGVVMSVSAEPGQIVAAGEPVIRLARQGVRDAVVQIPETARRFAGTAATASPYEGGMSMPASLYSLAAAADPATRTYEARYALPGASQMVALGSTITVQLTGRNAPLLVPLGALYDRGRGPGVWVVTGAPPVVRFRPVRVSALREEVAEISAGLRGGERVVALGAHLLKEGQKVRIEGVRRQ